MQYRRFGKTGLELPVISCGGMRFQHAWKDIEKVPAESQANVEACVRRALELGINHIETARGYGSSEYQLGRILPQFERDKLIVQTKVGPNKILRKFVDTFERSMRLLGLEYIDLFSFHGVNDMASFEATLRCLDQARAWQRAGRIRHIGFSTHACLAADQEPQREEVLLEAIRTGAFAYVNLHWFYIMQDNWPAILEARQRDMGVFIISPNDKGGLLYQPSEKLRELCAPLHPMVFNGLFCLARPEVHTLSCGVSVPEDFDLHLDTVAKLDDAAQHIAPIERRLEQALEEALGQEWRDTWQEGLPEWHETPGAINIPVILRLRNLALAFDMIEYGKMRYNLLGNGGSWFPGNTAGKLAGLDLAGCLRRSPHAARIPAALAETHTLLAGEAKKRLQEG